MTSTAAGAFVVFEGGEGVGKSTQVARLASFLRAQGHRVVCTREPGSTPVGKAIREILLDPATGALDHHTEALLYAADRAEHVATVVRPALARGDVVISDRYVDSSLAYQGAGRALAVNEVADLSSWATGGLHPDLTVVLDVAPEVGLARFDGADRLEAESLDFHRRVRQGFLDRVAAEPHRYAVVDADQDVEIIEAEVRTCVLNRLEHALTPPKASS